MSQFHTEAAAGAAAGDAAKRIEIDSGALAKFLTCQIDEIRKLNRRLETTIQELQTENALLKARLWAIPRACRGLVDHAANALRRFPLLFRVARAVYVRLRGVAGKVRRRLRPAQAA